MAKYLYNGVELPQLPEWDNVAYPYALIYRHIESGNYYLRCGEQAFVDRTHATVPNIYQSGKSVWYSNDGSAWKYGDSDVAGDTISPTYNNIIWTNHNILSTKDSSVYLAASDPIPVTSSPAPDPTSMLMGWLVGRAIAGQRGKKAEPSEPIAYLYNGVQLPKLPEWDKEKYPYAYITASTSPRRLILTATNKKVMRTNGTCSVTATNPYDSYAVYELTDGEWVSGTYNGSFIAVWCSEDLYYSSVLSDDTDSDLAGTLYLAASEPVPVYA